MLSKQRSHLTVTEGAPHDPRGLSRLHLFSLTEFAIHILQAWYCRWCELLEGIRPQYMTSAEPSHQLTLVVLSKPYKSHLVYAYSSIWRKMDIIKIQWRRKRVIQTSLLWTCVFKTEDLDVTCLWRCIAWCSKCTPIPAVKSQETFLTLFCALPLGVLGSIFLLFWF